MNYGLLALGCGSLSLLLAAAGGFFAYKDGQNTADTAQKNNNKIIANTEALLESTDGGPAAASRHVDVQIQKLEAIRAKDSGSSKPIAERLADISEKIQTSIENEAMRADQIPLRMLQSSKFLEPVLVTYLKECIHQLRELEKADLVKIEIHNSPEDIRGKINILESHEMPSSDQLMIFSILPRYGKTTHVRLDPSVWSNKSGLSIGRLGFINFDQQNVHSIATPRDSDEEIITKIRQQIDTHVGSLLSVLETARLSGASPNW